MVYRYNLYLWVIFLFFGPITISTATITAPVKDSQRHLSKHRQRAYSFRLRVSLSDQPSLLICWRHHKLISHHLVNVSWLRSKWHFDHCRNKLPESCVISILCQSFVPLIQPLIELKSCLWNMARKREKKLLWCDLNVTVWRFCLFSVLVEKILSLVQYFFFPVCSWSCPLVLGILRENKQKKSSFGVIFCTAKSSLPPPLLINMYACLWCAM